MSIDENGFLDSDISIWITKHRADNNALFNLCEDINRYAQPILNKLEINKGDAQELLVVLLYVRALSTYQACIILCERGMVSETRILLRSLIELLFRTSAISKDYNIALAFIQEDEVNRRKFINKFKNLSAELKNHHGNPELDDLLKTINSEIEDKDIKELKTQWFAQKSGLNDYYNTAYSVFSNAVHANVRHLQDYVVTDSDGNIETINYGPNVKGLDLLLLTAGETMLLMLKDINKLFKFDAEKTIEDMHSKFKETYLRNQKK